MKSGRDHFILAATAAGALTVAMIGSASLAPTWAKDGRTAGDADWQAAVQVPVATAGQEEISKLLPVLLASPERRKMAAEIEAALRRGDVQAAETQLGAAIEIGTLAIVLVDQLRDPALLQALQGLGIRGEDPTAPNAGSPEGKAAEACVLRSEQEKSGLIELQEALKREKAQSTVAAEELALLTQAHRDLLAHKEIDAATEASRIAELTEALQQRQEERDAAAVQLATLRDEYSALQSLREQDTSSARSKVSELENVLARERERSDETSRQLAAAQEELRSLQLLSEKAAASETSRIAELTEALAREKIRGDAVTRELADAIEELRTAQEESVADYGPTPLMFRLQSDGMAAPLDLASDDRVPAQPQIVLAAAPPPPVAEPIVTSALPEGARQVASAVTPDSGMAGASPGRPTSTEERLLARANELFRMGDVSGARLLLERSLDAGNARAAFLLAETFDPKVLAGMGALGLRGDPDRARALYARAQALGVVDAKERIQALK